MKLRARDLGFGYPGKPVGRDVTLAVEGGEVHCLLGPNGSGKTTLFKTLLGLLPPQAGTIHIGEERLENLSRQEIARRIAWVPQAHVPPFPYPVREVVLMGRTARLKTLEQPGKRDHEAVEQALETLRITDLGDADYTRISGGQRQLVLIARALAQEAPLMVMDEPTASLDFGNRAIVLGEILRLAERGLGILLSTHDPDQALAIGTQVALIKDGRLLAQGLPEEVLTGAWLSKVYGVEVSVERVPSGLPVCVPAFDRIAAGPGAERT
jgi:iron complex transport system ATP-binding protein